MTDENGPVNPLERMTRLERLREYLKLNEEAEQIRKERQDVVESLRVEAGDGGEMLFYRDGPRLVLIAKFDEDGLLYEVQRKELANAHDRADDAELSAVPPDTRLAYLRDTGGELSPSGRVEIASSAGTKIWIHRDGETFVDSAGGVTLVHIAAPAEVKDYRSQEGGAL